jgi:hypothetical protein
VGDWGVLKKKIYGQHCHVMADPVELYPLCILFYVTPYFIVDHHEVTRS